MRKQPACGTDAENDYSATARILVHGLLAVSLS